jgi:5-methylcytosine-specific restriction endonuclease McrA
VETALRQGRLCLSSVCELAKVVTPENVAEVLPRFFGLSRREAEAVAASIRPAAAIPQREVLTSARANALAGEEAAPSERMATEPELHPGEPEQRMDLALTPPAASVPVRPTDSEQPLTAELFRFHITVSRQFMATLEQTRDALSHSHPGASTEEVLMACMQLMLSKKAKEKGLVQKPLERPRPSRSDHIPAHVRRAVMKRSGGRCEWVFENGERCNSAYQVEVDHIVPEALGGLATVENTRAACRGHNQLAARQVFGDAFMDRFTRRRREPVSHHTAARSGPTPPAGAGTVTRAAEWLRRPSVSGASSGSRGMRCTEMS